MATGDIAVARSVDALRQAVASWRARRERVGLVPTMGAIHAGHLALVHAARGGCERVVASLFVNPKQFAPSEDLAAYPRNEAADLAAFGTAGVDLVFIPTVDAMYPPGFATSVEIGGVSEGLDGAHRPGHFAGVATVVAKLLLQCLPDAAYFGEKDYQQLMVVRRLARDLDPRLVPRRHALSERSRLPGQDRTVRHAERHFHFLGQRGGLVQWRDGPSRVTQRARGNRRRSGLGPRQSGDKQSGFRARRRELEVGVNGLSRRERPLFATAAKDWLARKTNLTPLGVRYYRQYIAKLSEFLGKRLISDITAEDVADLQGKRKSQGLSGRHINAEVGTLRAILRYYGRWAYISGRVTMLPQRSDAGRSLTQNEEARLLEAIGHSRSPSLYPFFTLSIDAGLRPSETRALRRSNLRLSCHGGSISAGEIIVGRSKSEAGEGRAIPLTRRARAALTLWLARFPDARPESYVFPFHRVAIAGNQRVPHIYDINLDRPMSPSSYRTAFETACRRANV